MGGGESPPVFRYIEGAGPRPPVGRPGDVSNGGQTMFGKALIKAFLILMAVFWAILTLLWQ